MVKNVESGLNSSYFFLVLIPSLLIGWELDTCLISLYLSFLNYKIGAISLCDRVIVKLKGNIMYLKQFILNVDEKKK